MKKTNYHLLLLFTLLLVTTITAQKFRKYGIKSGTIEYKLSGDAVGSSITKWDDWGRKEIQIQDTKTTVWGMTNEEHKTTLMLGTDMYIWKKGENQIQKTKSPIAKILGKENYDENDIESFSKKSLESLGYKKTGEESFDGKECEVYDGIGGKLWIWKKNKIAIKVDVNILGIKMISEATKIDLNANVSSSLFEIPNGMEIVEIESMNYNSPNSKAQDESVQKAVKDLLGGLSQKGNDASKDRKDTVKNASDDNFTDELLEETKDAAVEGAKEGAKETAKEEAKKEVKKKVKSLLKSLF